MKVLNPEYPLTAEFRSGPRGIKRSYDDWLDQQMMPEGYPVDLQSNVLRFEPKNFEFANRFAREHPETMVLSTWRAASGTPKGANDDGDPLGVSTIEFPGHWVLSPGTTLASTITSTSQTLRVASTNNMRQGPALLVETDSSGDKLWDRFEYVLITSVGTGTITVRREFNGSPVAREFPSTRTYVAPMPWDSRNRKPFVDWFFNLSKYCPKDSIGRTAMDVLHLDMLKPLELGGPLDHIGGLDLASGPLTVTPANADYNLDGIEDPDSVYRDGVRTFYQRIREVLGPDRVLTTSLDYEFLDYINGVNQEGLAEPDDPWNEVTETVNEVLAWRKLSKLPMVSLAFQQHMSREEDLLRVNMQRLLNGYSVCLGMAADIETGSGSDALDAIKRIELYKGDENVPHWLGKQLSMKRVALTTPNLLNGATSPTDWDTIIPALSVKRGTLEVEGSELVLSPEQRNFSGYVTLDLQFPLNAKSDFTVFMEAISDDDQIERKILLPRVNVDVETKALRAKLTNKDYLPIAFFVRGADRGSISIDFRFGPGGPVRFRSLSVHAATDALACEFEKGVVIVNPSLEDEFYDLQKLFPGRGGFRRLSASEPNGAGDIPDKYRPQLQQALEINNGQSVSNKRSVMVPERNSVFLIADAAKSGNGRLEVNGFQILPASGNHGNVVKVPTPPRSIPQPTIRPTEAPAQNINTKPTAQQRPAGNNSNDEPALQIVGNNLPIILGKCQGDCDNDSDCRGNLVCYQRNKRSPDFVYGCKGFAKQGTDFCVNPTAHEVSRIEEPQTNIFEGRPLPPDGDSGNHEISEDSGNDAKSTPSVTIGASLAIGIISASLAIGLLLVFHRRKNKKATNYVSVIDGQSVGPVKPLHVDLQKVKEVAPTETVLYSSFEFSSSRTPPPRIMYEV